MGYGILIWNYGIYIMDRDLKSLIGVLFGCLGAELDFSGSNLNALDNVFYI